MGVVLDSSVFIAGERKGATVLEILDLAREACGDQEVVMSVMSAAELVHGIYRAQSPSARAKRQDFVEEVFVRIPVRSVTLQTARIAGELDARLRLKGTTIPTADLLIASTALELSFSVATHNVRHFRLVSKLNVLRLA